MKIIVPLFKAIASIFIHVHDWKTIFEDDPKKVQECGCGDYRSTCYHMGNGDTYWAKGNLWA